MNPGSHALAQVCVLLASAYPAVQFDDARMEVWASMLDDIQPATLISVVQRHIASCPFPPSIAEIRAACADAEHGDAMSGTEAWGLVLREIARVGWPGTPEFPQEVATVLRNTVNWLNLCTADLDQIPSHRARFIDAFDARAKRTRRDQLTPPHVRKQIADIRAARIIAQLAESSRADRTLPEDGPR